MVTCAHLSSTGLLGPDNDGYHVEILSLHRGRMMAHAGSMPQTLAHFLIEIVIGCLELFETNVFGGHR